MFSRRFKRRYTREGEVITIDRSKGLILLTVVVVATILGGIALTTAGADSGEEDTDKLTSLVANTNNENTIEVIPLVVNTEDESTDGSTEFIPWGMKSGTCARGGSRGLGGLRGPRGFGFVEVSEEFEANVINIAESDEDVQALLDDGYNITMVRPIIKTVVDGEGNIVTKATDAILILSKDETGKASVWVNLEEAKVTEIMIITRTIIEKP